MIPTQVKIQGRIVLVEISGRGYVCVGESRFDIPEDTRIRIEAMSTEDHYKPWQEAMQVCFESALAAERLLRSRRK